MNYLERQIQNLRDECDSLKIGDTGGHLALIGRILELMSGLAHNAASTDQAVVDLQANNASAPSQHRNPRHER